MGPGSAMREKGKNGVKKEKYRRAKQAKRWSGEGKRPPPFPFPRLPLGSLRSPIFFLFHPIQSLVPGYIYKEDVSLKWTPRVAPSLSLLLSFDSL